VFPVRHELDLYILFRRISDFTLTQRADTVWEHSKQEHCSALPQFVASLITVSTLSSPALSSGFKEIIKLKPNVGTPSGMLWATRDSRSPLYVPGCQCTHSCHLHRLTRFHPFVAWLCDSHLPHLPLSLAQNNSSFRT
jgi:hypothetical protein